MATEPNVMLKSATTRFPLEDYAWLERQCKEKNMTISDVLRNIVHAYRMQFPDKAQLTVDEIAWVTEEAKRQMDARMAARRANKRSYIHRIIDGVKGVFKKC